MPTEWNLTNAAHLLRRAGFGGSFEQVSQLHALGFEGAIDQLVEYDRTADPTSSGVTLPDLNISSPAGVIQYQLYRMAASTRPLQEKLTWFWHGHFVSALGKCPAELMSIQLDTWRAHANGRFREFLTAMYRDPAMLLYLDNNTNIVGKPNENFARELMELFALGIGNYSETDVREAARALTGWTVLPRNRTESVFIDRRHDQGVKTVLGFSDILGAEQLMDILYTHPACAPYVCRKLYQYFVGPEASAAELATMVDAWRQSDGHIKQVLHVLFRLDSFWTESSRRTLIKSPVEYGIGLYQRLNVDLDAAGLKVLSGALSNMGQTPLIPPDVSGYPINLGWAGTSNLLSRYNAAYKLFYGLSAESIENFLTGLDLSTSVRLLEAMLERLGPLELGEASYSAVLSYLENGNSSGRNRTRILQRARGALHLIAVTPEFQLN